MLELVDALVSEAHQAFGKVDIFLAIDLGRGVCAGVEFKLCLENKNRRCPPKDITCSPIV